LHRLFRSLFQNSEAFTQFKFIVPRFTVSRRCFSAPSPVKFSPTTKDDIADLLDLTAPPSPSKASKTEDVDAAKLLDGISIPDIASKCCGRIQDQRDEE
jgi:hypothetical protein